MSELKDKNFAAIPDNDLDAVVGGAAGMATANAVKSTKGATANAAKGAKGASARAVKGATARALKGERGSKGRKNGLKPVDGSED